MADTGGEELTLAKLAKRIEDQARFTRTVTIICTLAVLGVVFYSLTEAFSSMPQAVILHYMANIEPIVREWRAAEDNLNKSAAKKQAEPATAPATTLNP